MKTDFRKSFARDLRRRKNDSDFLDRVKEAIEKAMFALSVETDPKQHSIKIQQKSLGVAL
jgi:hypothetical protein